MMLIFLTVPSIALQAKYKYKISVIISNTDTIKHSQHHKRKHHHLPPPPKPPSLSEIANENCAFYNKFTISQRLKNYPFSKATKILAVSYHLQDLVDSTVVDTVTGKIISNPALSDSIKSGFHVNNKVLDYSSLIEVKQLNQHQTNDLTNIIYNTTYRKRNRLIIADPGGACFNPRNALVFFDKNGQVFDYMEICFECERYESLSEKITLGTYCNQKYDLLKQFFIDAGIKYGTIKK